MKKLFMTAVIVAVYFVSGITFAEPPTGINLGHDYTFQLVTGDLTATGVQYSTMDTTGTAAAELALFTKSIDLVFGNQSNQETSHKFIIDLYFEIFGSFAAATTGTADIEWKPQARNKDGTWTDLASYVDIPDIGTSFTASNLKGYAETSSTLDEIPLDFRILMKCDEDDEGIGKIKSGSYIRITFRDITWGN